MTMKAGRYYVGDLCYVMNDEEWDKVTSLLFDANCYLTGEFNLPDGTRFASYFTAYGDGTYRDQHGRSYSVDSGTIGCIHVEDIKTNKYEHIEELGNFIEFDQPFVSGMEDGLITFGSVVIDTDPAYEDEDEEDDEWEDEE